MIEEWRPVIGFEGIYEVSNFGEVKSLPRNGTVLAAKTLMGFIDGGGYQQVLLTEKRIHKKIHRLVAEHFIVNHENKPCINHIDRDRSNNRVDNLEWCTHKENIAHMYKMGYKAAEMENHSQSKLDSTQLLTIISCLPSLTSYQLSDYFRVHVATIRNIRKGNHWIYRRHPELLQCDL